MGVPAACTGLREPYLTYPTPTRGKDETWSAACWRISAVTLLLSWRHRIRNFWEHFSFKYEHVAFIGEK